MVRSTCAALVATAALVGCGGNEPAGNRDPVPAEVAECTPRTCTQLNGACGLQSNGCGGVLECGACGETPQPSAPPARAPEPANGWLVVTPGERMDSLWVSASPEGGAIVQLRSSFESSTFSELRKYSAEGSLEWSFALPSGEEGADSPVVTASGDALAWPQSGGRIHRVTANGSQSASLSIEGYSSIGRDGVASSPMGALLVLPWEPSGASVGRLLSQEGAVVVEFVGEANSSVTAGAFDLQGNVFLYVARGPVFVGARALVGPGRHLVKLSPAGELLWSTPVLEGAYDVEGERLVLGEDGTAFLLGSFHGQASWGETELTYTQVSNSGWPAYAQFALAASPNGAPQWGRLVSAYGRLATRLPGGGLALLKQSGCGGIKLVALGPDGSAQGERALAGPECGSESGQIFPTSLATAKDGAILVGGFFTGTARFGQQRAEAQGMDGFAFKASAASSN